MAYIYKLIFDISVYYGISGYYLMLYADVQVSLAGMLLLVAALVLYRLLGDRWPDARWKRMVLLLPALTLLFSQAISVLLHLILAWAYGAYCAVTEKTQLTYEGFRKRFGRSLLLLLILVPPFINNPMADEALSASAIYVIVQLLCGVSCIRCLREKQENMRQMLIMLCATGLCGLLTMFGVPQFLAKCLNDYVIQVMINGLMIIGLLMASLVFALFDWLMSINGPPNMEGGISLDTDSIAEIMGLDPSDMASADADFFWLNMIGYIVGALLILTVLAFLIYKLIKSAKNRHHKDGQKGWSVERQMLRNSGKLHRISRRKPQHPRETVRYYFAKYMHESNKRGVKIRRDWTSKELGTASEPYFAKQDIAAMEDLYRSARYNLREEIPQQSAKQAAKIWQNMKKTK